jgi:hypothetical protein
MDNLTYEYFIRRAWECDRFQKGANTDTWESLLCKKFNYEDAKGKPNETKLKKEYENKLAQVKNYIDNAYDNLLYRMIAINNNDEIVNSLLDLKTEAMNSTTPEDLNDVLRRSFQVLNDKYL